MKLNLVKYEHLTDSSEAVIQTKDQHWVVNSTISDRTAIFSVLTHQWVLFTDSDVELTEVVQDQLQNWIQQASKEIVYCGLYENPSGATALQQAHNALSNFWLKQGYLKPRPHRLLGGFFLLFIDPKKMDRIKPLPHFWGGEDVFLGYHLQQAGFDLCLKTEWKLPHHTSKSYRHFIKRAWLHGWNHELLPIDTDTDFRSEFFSWIQFLKTQKIVCGALIMFHFMLFFCAKIIRKTFPQNKSSQKL